MLLFVKLQVAIKEHGIMLIPNSHVMAQNMSKDPDPMVYKCWEIVTLSKEVWGFMLITSPLPCNSVVVEGEYPKEPAPKYPDDPDDPGIPYGPIGGGGRTPNAESTTHTPSRAGNGHGGTPSQTSTSSGKHNDDSHQMAEMMDEHDIFDTPIFCEGSGGVEGGTLKDTSPKYLEDLLEDLQNKEIKKLLDDFLKSQKETVYPEMEKNLIVQRINELVANPWKITQGENGTCGAAVICKYLLEKHPVTFVKAVLGIIQNGKYSPWGLTADPDSYGFSGFDGSKSIALDQIIQGAMVNTMNMLFDYNPAEDGESLYSFVWPGRLSALLNKMGVSFDYYSYCSKHPNLKELDYDSSFVIGLANMNTSTHAISEGIPTHYFQITGFKNGEMHFWSWGIEDNNSHTTNPSLYNIWILK